MLAFHLKTIGMVLMIAGITTEAVLRADIGYVLITSGALVFAVGANVRYRNLKRKRRRQCRK